MTSTSPKICPFELATMKPCIRERCVAYDGEYVNMYEYTTKSFPTEEEAEVYWRAHREDSDVEVYVKSFMSQKEIEKDVTHWFFWTRRKKVFVDGERCYGVDIHDKKIRCKRLQVERRR